MQDDSDYRPRAHDHLVEPMFRALGDTSEDRPAARGGEVEGGPDGGGPGLLRRWLAAWSPGRDRGREA